MTQYNRPRKAGHVIRAGNLACRVSRPGYSAAALTFFVLLLSLASARVLADPAADAVQLFGEAWRLAQAGDNVTAAKKYRAGLLLKPDSAPAHFYLGKALAAIEETTEAITQFRETVRLAPQSKEGREASSLIAAFSHPMGSLVPLTWRASKEHDGWVQTDGGCYVWRAPDQQIEHQSWRWSGGCVNGRGSGIGELLAYQNGKIVERFNGSMQYGKYNGQGHLQSMSSLDGRVFYDYQGTFHENEFDGNGILTNVTSENIHASRYEGHFCKGAADGAGAAFINGVKLDGAADGGCLNTQLGWIGIYPQGDIVCINRTWGGKSCN